MKIAFVITLYKDITLDPKFISYKVMYINNN